MYVGVCMIVGLCWGGVIQHQALSNHQPLIGGATKIKPARVCQCTRKANENPLQERPVTYKGRQPDTLTRKEEKVGIQT